MERLTAKNPYKASLIRGLHTIERELKMEEEDIVLILMSLDTEEKIERFLEWVLSKLDGEKILARPNEIVRAAVEIGEETMDLP